MKNVILVCFLLVSSNYFSQKDNYFGGGLTLGYKSIYDAFGFSANARMISHFDINIGFSISNLNGGGGSIGASYVFLKDRVRPFVGIQYLKTMGVKSFNLWYKSEFTEFKTNSTEYFYVKSGLSFLMTKKENDTDDNSLTYFTFTLTFRENFYSNHRIHYLSGEKDYPFVNQKNKLIGNGLGGSISLILLFGK